MNRGKDRQGQLVCPHCQTSFPLTWNRYLSAPWRNYQCPQCQQASYLKDNSSWLWPIRLAAIIFYTIFGINEMSYVVNSVGVVGTLIQARLFRLLIVLVFVLLINKWIDGHMRQLNKFPQSV